MEGSVQNVRREKRSKEEKKVQRRAVRATHTLLQHEGIRTMPQPTRFLVVSNGGLGNGVSRELLLEVLKEAGGVVSLLMPPGKPYSFVTFASVEESERAQALCTGRTLTCSDHQVTLYCSFIPSVDEGLSQNSSPPPGLCVLKNFISLEEEALLLQAVDLTSKDDDDDDDDDVRVQRELKHRRVKHYGYEFRYDNNNVDKDKPLPGGLPSVCDAVLQRCVSEGHISVLPDQLTINQYQSGQGIPPHVDTHSAFEDTILSLSLGGKTVMEFRHPDGRCVAVVLPGRSLLVMKGESRYLWTHGITPRKFDLVPASDSEGSGVVSFDPSNLTLHQRSIRTSFTFRKVRHTPCNCEYPSVCDSQRSRLLPRLPVAGGDACVLEEQYVHRVYEEISTHFSSTRHTPWPRVRDFLLSLPNDFIMADIGCGNGKYLTINPRVFSVGCDRSVNLLHICADRGFHSLVADALSVPLRSSVFDAVISIAVIHHFCTEERRLAAVTELVRLLKVGGHALIYVWAMEQEFKNQKSKYLKCTKNQENLLEIPQKEPENIHNEIQETSEMNPDDELMNSERSSITTSPKCRSVDPDKCPTCVGPVHAGSGSPAQLSVHTNRTAFSSQDLLVPWHLKGAPESGGGAVFHRFYHVFQQGELEALCQQVGCITVQQSYYDQGNWCVVLQKTH